MRETRFIAATNSASPSGSPLSENPIRQQAKFLFAATRRTNRSGSDLSPPSTMYCRAVRSPTLACVDTIPPLATAFGLTRPSNNLAIRSRSGCRLGSGIGNTISPAMPRVAPKSNVWNFSCISADCDQPISVKLIRYPKRDDSNVVTACPRVACAMRDASMSLIRMQISRRAALTSASWSAGPNRSTQYEIPM